MFEISDWRDVKRLIEDYPLAWLCAAGGQESCQLPLIGLFDDESRPFELIGHFARSNPIAAALTASPHATILFSGPNGYVSPHHAGRRNWGPTWNYVHVRIEAEITIDATLTEQALDLLIAHVENSHPNPWAAHELGERYQALLSRIIGFRATVLNVQGRFKLGQDEDVVTLDSILNSHEEPELVDWMRHANRDRIAKGA